MSKKPLAPVGKGASASQRAQRDKERVAQRRARMSGPGPGDYDPRSDNAWTREIPQRPSSAFARATPKRPSSPSTARKAAEAAGLGPGSYDPKRADEIGRSTTFNKKGEQGSLSFGTRSARGKVYDEPIPNTPGPGAYDYADPKSIAASTSARVLLGKTAGTSAFRSSLPQHDDPMEAAAARRSAPIGIMYNPIVSSPAKLVSMPRAARFSASAEKSVAPAPGAYEVRSQIGASGEDAKRQSAVFASSSLRHLAFGEHTF
ncbi:hypothetical protein KFE25_013262 [Diacronema lutheri]|uniref:Uncharacterized protein n=1 Tax=Diacronema lutheri TaxID=2081491 RepID=A0A8J5XQ67_DIALT|nr:hypothetical protein KFE25_013262 [Diacronema lutheri]